MTQFPDNAAHAAHAPGVGPSRQPAPEGGHEPPPASGGDTGQHGEPCLVEPAGRGRLALWRYPRHRCPECGHAHLRKYRSIRDQGDGTAMAWVKCLSCKHRFKIMLQ